MYEVEPAGVAGTLPPEVKHLLHWGFDLQPRAVSACTMARMGCKEQSGIRCSPSRRLHG